jgi:galactokinase
MQCRENHYFSGMDSKIAAQFFQHYKKGASVFAAPGRINLIGEHTDYNQGFVLPGAIDKKIYLAIAKNDQSLLNVYANQYPEQRSFSLVGIKPTGDWTTYLLGIVYNLQQRGHHVGGVDILLDGDVPLGAGMSSSAALCSAFGFALNDLFELGLSTMDLALLGQATEHNFAGVQCGIMDQFASLHGKAVYLMKLDCRSLEYEYIPFHFPDYRIVLVNTMVTHSLASTEYNIRRQQCEGGVAVLKKYYPGISSLRDLTREMLAEHQDELEDPVFRRCSFVIEENDRLLRGCAYLQKGDLGSFGELMFLAHEGLSKWYEVSCRESDFLVALARSFPGVLGARQMGGGFGGCTINIVAAEAVEAFSAFMQAGYSGQFNILPKIYVTQIEDGAKKLIQEP